METVLLYRSSLTDKVLLFLVVASIFFEPLLPYFGGSSTTFFLFVFIAIYVAVNRAQAITKIVKSKYFLAFIFFTLVCVLMESIHYYQSYEYILRFVNMGMGIFSISLLCRDKDALDVTITSFILCSAANSLYLFAGPFNYLRSYSVEGFNEASKARIEAFEQFSMRDHLNDISIFSGLGSILGIIALTYERIRWRKVVYAVLIFLSLVGIFLPASRTGALIFIVSLAIFAYKSKLKLKPFLIPVVVFTIALALIVPDVVWVRIGSIARLGEIRGEDSRAKLYQAILGNIDQYLFTGVGSGYYWKSWAVKAGITNINDVYVPMAPHNAFFQVWIYWGLPGFLSFLFMMYTFSKALNKRIYKDRQKASIYIFMVIIPVVFLFYSSFYHKAFAVGVGLLLASRYWNLFAESEEAVEARMHAYG